VKRAIQFALRRDDHQAFPAVSRCLMSSLGYLAPHPLSRPHELLAEVMLRARPNRPSTWLLLQMRANSSRGTSLRGLRMERSAAAATRAVQRCKGSSSMMGTIAEPGRGEFDDNSM
jgi:hypothetical protein